MTIAELQLALPEIFVLSMTCIVLLADLFISDERRGLTHTLAILTLVFAAILTLRVMQPVGVVEYAFSGTFVRDRFGDVLKIFSYLILAGVFVYAKHYLRRFGLFKGEFYTLSLFALLGVMVMISASNLITVYLGLELLALSTYALVALDRDSRFGSEAAMKYFILGSLASGILLYGMSLIYGATGSLDLATISQNLSMGAGDSMLLTFGLVFVVIAIAFKIGAVPFHMWVPDVYHGAPLAITTLISSVPKLAYLALAIRLLDNGMIGLHQDWMNMLAVLIGLSLILGNVVAIAQDNIKRMLAYSTISHMGFMLMGVMAGTPEGYSAAMFYAIAYAIMSAGAFAVVILVSSEREADRIEDYKGLAKRNPWHALLMLMIMFSLAGVPVFLGFFAKWQVIAAALAAGFIWLAVLAVIMSVVGAFYYLRIVKLMYFDAPEDSTPVTAPVDFRAVLTVNGVAVLALGIFSGGLISLCVSAFS
ncbi:NADH-quinone oxidoreductase subunit NuoN [Wenzhouxiangella marina]|uniref:NADH-quinone oxidoreductase subunit N n=1 Tax=Wenzhouxiangella marina TaxID=1579979 RepID=A0A0K0XTP8_9GAMM|nr:NADH-quinone oxidoreductase subunit NuoN [Wenzhouxiangella marina]AKS40996.1 NADH:ubiquinone oxidoreductase subunit N [Wenzhouxiangella marina]MBB6087870.1 NADH-quinone oxidoreductase subunit N [Wenzhouxiangella marina]